MNFRALLRSALVLVLLYCAVMPLAGNSLSRSRRRQSNATCQVREPSALLVFRERASWPPMWRSKCSLARRTRLRPAPKDCRPRPVREGQRGFGRSTGKGGQWPR
jgi:hypothetical protein